MNKPVTIKDIARALNIHHTTVSRALRNHPAINPATRKKVRETASQMGYSRNTVAANLRNRNSKIIGIMVPTVEPHFFSSLISHLSSKADQAGYTVMIFQSNDSYEIEQQNINALIQNRVAGVIISMAAATEQYDHYQRLRKQNIPTVFFDRVPSGFDAHKVLIDNYHAAYQATEYLLEAGRRDIAFFAGPRDVSIFHERQQGYQDALKKHNIAPVQNRIFRSELSIQAGRETMQRMINNKDRPDAILCVVDLLAFGAMRTLHDHNISIPQDIALIGFDDHPAAEVVYPALTTMAQPIDTIAQRSFDLLQQLINGPGLAVPATAPLQMQLIKRQSA